MTPPLDRFPYLLSESDEDQEDRDQIEREKAEEREDWERENQGGALVMDKITVAREAILQELRRRWKEDRAGGVTAPADIHRFCHPQTNYFCGAGSMDCPICRTGKLQYERSSHNGHVHARCSTDGCVAWME